MSYDQITDTRRLAGAMWKFLFGAGVVIALVSIWQPQLGFASVVLGLLGMHAATADILLGRIAGLQAALDMRRIHDKTQPGTTSKYVMAPGDAVSLDFANRSIKIVTNSPTTLEITL